MGDVARFVVAPQPQKHLPRVTKGAFSPAGLSLKKPITTTNQPVTVR